MRELSVFDIIGPIMIGPSSSHTAGAARIGLVARSLLENGFTDSFRFRNPDATGCYTWWSYMYKARQNNAGWRIDYFLVSNRLADKVKAAPIYSEILGSDHCPVGLELEI